jgi:hypothetical protein
MQGQPAIVIAALLSGLSAMTPARADAPPYVTNDPEIADKLELSPFLQWSGRSRVSIDTVAVDVSIPLAARWEMSIVPRFARVTTPQGRFAGPGDTEVAVKYLAVPESALWPAIALEPNITFPTGGRRMGDGVVAIELPLLISKTFGPWRLSGQLGYERDGTHARDDRAPISLLLERTIAKDFSLGVEIANDVPMRRPGHGSIETNLGGSWAIHDGLTLHVALGRRLASADASADVHTCLALAVEL